MRPHFRFWPARLPHTLVLPETTLWYNLEVSAARHPRRAAARFLGADIDYVGLRRKAEALAGWLQQAAGVRRGDRVLVFLQNSPQHIIATYAALRADAVVVPVNPMNLALELRHMIADSGARVAICAADLAHLVDEANEGLSAEQRITHLLATRYADEMPSRGSAAADEATPPAWLDWLYSDPVLPPGAARWRDVLERGLAPQPAQAGADDLALIAYTSGTTGLPKGCMHTHRTLMHNVVGMTLWGNASADAVVLGAVPMFHITGALHVMHMPIYAGATVVMMPRWNREVAGSLIERYKVTSWTNIPTMIVDLFASPNVDRLDLRSLLHIGGGGAAMPQAVAERLQRDFGLTYVEGYGLTETAAPTHANPPDRAKLQCLGIPVFGTDARVVDPVDLRELEPGAVGEIIVHGPQVFKGYWRNPPATGAAFVEFDRRRFFRTGDLGRMDEDGYFFITDRLKRMINASGYKVWPAEVETVLYGHPAVQEACVISRSDPYRGETVKAVVVLRAQAQGTVDDQQIIGWAREKMAAYKVPTIVEFVDALPKSGSGKVLWRVLQERENAKP